MYYRTSVKNGNFIATFRAVKDLRNQNVMSEMTVNKCKYLYCTVHCNIIIQYKPTKCNFSKLIF